MSVAGETVCLPGSILDARPSGGIGCSVWGATRAIGSASCKPRLVFGNHEELVHDVWNVFESLGVLAFQSYQWVGSDSSFKIKKGNYKNTGYDSYTQWLCGLLVGVCFLELTWLNWLSQQVKTLASWVQRFEMIWGSGVLCSRVKVDELVQRAA